VSPGYHLRRHWRVLLVGAGMALLVSAAARASWPGWSIRLRAGDNIDVISRQPTRRRAPKRRAEPRLSVGLRQTVLDSQKEDRQ